MFFAKNGKILNSLGMHLMISRMHLMLSPLVFFRKIRKLSRGRRRTIVLECNGSFHVVMHLRLSSAAVTLAKNIGEIGTAFKVESPLEIRRL